MKRNLPTVIIAVLLVATLAVYMIAYQVQFNEVAVVRTFGKITPPAPRFLFSIEPGLGIRLNGGTVPAALQRAFERHGITLSNDAAVSIEQTDERGQPRWTVTDGGRRYVLHKHHDGISVHDLQELVSEDVITEPGLKWKWPWPVQQVTVYDNRIQVSQTTGEETPTRDLKNVIVTTTIGWRIDDPYTFDINNKDVADAEEKLKTRVRNDQKTVIAQYDFSNFVSTRRDELRYDEIERKILEAVKVSAEALYGINVEFIGLEKLALPNRITENVFSAMKQERQAQAARYTSEGESEADRIKAEAESIAGTILAFAERKAEGIIAVGKRRAAEYNTVFRKDEGLAIFLLELDYLMEILKERATIILEGRPPFDLLREWEETAGKEVATRAATEAGLSGVEEAAARAAGNVALPEMVRPK